MRMDLICDYMEPQVAKSWALKMTLVSGKVKTLLHFKFMVNIKKVWSIRWKLQTIIAHTSKTQINS